MIESQYIIDILTLLLDGEDTKEVSLQIPFLKDVKHEYTGMGLFVHFETTESIGNEIKAHSKLIDGISIESEDLADGGYAVLFFDEEGIIDNLEIVSNDGNYPNKDLSNYTLTQVWIGSSNKKISHQ